MPDLILHHYWTSPFGEKCRAALGYKNLTWRSCEVGVIPPRPSLEPFLSPFRRIPVLQIGADFFCDSRLILKVIEAIAPEPTIFPKPAEGLCSYVAGWVEPQLFMSIQALRFRTAEDVDAVSDGKFSAAEFAADRRPFANPESLREPVALAASRADWLHACFDAIRAQLAANGAFMTGDSPAAADFSLAHIVWFLRRPPARDDLFEGYADICAWAERVLAHGPGDYEPISFNDARAEVSRSQGEPGLVLPWSQIEDPRLGREVVVAPGDYGKSPMRGTLIASTREHVAIERQAAGFGTVRVHVPRIGHEIVDAAILDEDAPMKRAG